MSTGKWKDSSEKLNSSDELKKLQKEIKHLTQENKVLHIRAEGVQVLGKVLQDSQESNARLQQEVQQLKSYLAEKAGIDSLCISINDDSRSTTREQSNRYHLSMLGSTDNRDDVKVTMVSEPQSLSAGLPSLLPGDFYIKLREKEQQEENLRRQLREMEQQLKERDRHEKTLQARLISTQQQVDNLERQRRDREQDMVKLNKSLSEVKEKLKKYESQETHDWIIPREEIVMTDKRLGSGGWGYVKEGKYCGCTVAVKKLFKKWAISPLNRSKFEREMDIASRCRHPCLLQFIGATNDEKNPLFVTELMESSLRALLEQQPLSPAEVYIISLDVARALTYLHQKKPTPILHRDVSSANVLLYRRDDQWRGKVSDYGTARFLQDAMTKDPGAMIYSAPEASTPRQTVKIDVYSFGVLLCEMCIRESPDPERRIKQIAMVEDQKLQALIQLCVQSDPEDRPSMEEIIEELEELNKRS
ncbi:uncharacterized protein LOC144651500 [Oculina patagonica]